MKEDFSPVMRIDQITYRNLALRRPAYHSSSYDYNLTAQLVTDGIIDSKLPGWVVTSTSQHGALKKNEREWLIDRHLMTRVTLDSSSGWIQLEIGGSGDLPQVDSIHVSGSLLVNDQKAKGWDIMVTGSNDGKLWEKLGLVTGTDLPGDTLTGLWRRFAPKNLRVFNYPFTLQTPSRYRFYRVNLSCPNANSWSVGELALFNDGCRAEIGGPYHFTSAWMSAGHEQEWVYVDLGATCSFDRIVLHWLRRPAVGSVQVSNEVANAESGISDWKDIKALPEEAGLIDDLRLEPPVEGRYVRVLMKQPASAEGYILSEMEVFGRGGPVATPHPPPPVKDDGRMDLAGGAWRVQRESLVKASGEALSQIGFPDTDWVVATVPATVLVSYLNAGALPEPNFGDNQLMISESFFYADFWYRNQFTAPASYKGKRIYLNFDGINWKAEVFLNGKRLGRIEGAFTRGRFDVTGLLIPGGENALAVRIEKNATPGFVTEQTKWSPGANGGELGADNPTYHASVGWDWLPTIRGRNTGIWNDVYLTVSGPVTIEHPFITTDLPLPDTSWADVSVEVSLCNHESKKVNGILKGTFGEVEFNQPVTLKALETKKVKLEPSKHPVLRVQNPKLWWPNGYGQPNLYEVELKFVTKNEQVSDIKSFQTGIREMTYSEEDSVLKIWINGRRFVARGGNWGFPESLLRYRAREYDIAIRYHKDMNFTMIRNWVGQTGDDEFYQACDRQGIMIWQDFWLANPVDGPNPNDNTMFLQNVEDLVLRIRNHPSMALYCGRNEGNPPEILDTGIRKILAEKHPGVHYISNSAWGVVSGGGPYRAMPVKFYFQNRATTKLHSEMGMPNMVTYESLQKMMPDSALWPPGRMWGMHDFCLEGAQGGSSFIQQIEQSFGKVDNVTDWVSLAQWVNYQGYRAMFEAQGKNRMGLLLWMSHPAWPSLVWQTYDYYFEPTAAYFGCKKASEPLHIQWNPLSDSIEVVNYSARNGSGLIASLEILNLDGTVQLEKKTSLDCPEDSIVPCFGMEYPPGLTSVYFLRLKLMRGDEIVSENFYWRGLEEGNYQAARNLPKVTLNSKTQMKRKDNRWYLTTDLTNPSKQPALMVRLKVVREKSRERILPVLYSDNYVSLMPGEQRTIRMELEHADTGGEKPLVVIEGFNTSCQAFY
ncbi:MAG: discoidin domain-containing protein [candidate division KSB1 bacterium]|nr:discoidin domain-containing protein [candidate division KSB1 bacterium]